MAEGVGGYSHVHLIPHLEGLDQRREIGRGSFGVVYEVKMNSLPCIAKGLHDILLGRGGNLPVRQAEKEAIRAKFRNECALLGNLKHPNIVQFLGVHQSKDNDEWLVIELLDMDLAKCLEMYPDIPLPLKLSILRDVSYGLLHLHSQAPPIIHRDLTAPNILLTRGMSAKIADLGVSKIFDIRQLQRSAHTAAPGTWAYMPPEALSPDPNYDAKLDVFSYGVLTLYVANQEFPIVYEPPIPPLVTKKQEIQIYKRDHWVDKMGVAHPLHSVVMSCLKDRPDHRPTSKELNDIITKLCTQHENIFKNALELYRELNVAQKQLRACHMQDSMKYKQKAHQKQVVDVVEKGRSDSSSSKGEVCEKEEPSRTVVLPAEGQQSSDVSPSALMKAKQPGVRPNTASNQCIKQFSPKGSLSEMARQAYNHGDSQCQQLSPKGPQNRSLTDMVRQLLEEKQNGVWIKRLKKELEAKFKGANIPDDVGSFVVEMPFVQTDYPIPTNPIIYLKKQVVDVVEKGRSDSSSSKGEVCEKEGRPTVRLDDEFFDVVVTCINSPIDFYVQKCENDKLLLELQEGLGTYCTSNVPKVASQVVPNTLYAYLWADQEAQRNYWCRVLVVSCSDQKADVMFPDYGDTKVLPYKDLKELPSQFYELPFQAVQCSLHGVSDTTEAASLKFIELADQELCVAQVMNSSGHRCALELIPSNAEPGAETINSTILKLSQPISSLKPQLPNPGQPMVPVKLTDVDEDGLVSVQLLGPGLTYLDQLLTEMNNPNSRTHKEGKPMGFVTQRSVGAVCCAPFVDGTWYRAQIKKLISLKKVLVEYVDFGNEEEVDLNTTTLILPSTSDLFSLPFQAVKCTIHGLPPAGCSWTETSIEALTGFIDSGEMLLQVVKKPDNGGLPSIKLFFEEEEGGQMDVGEYLLSQGLFSHPHTVSQPLVPAAIPKTASLPSMKIVVTGQSGSDESYTRKVTVLQDDRTGAAQPAPQGPVERPQKGHSTSPPPSYEAVIEHSEKSPSHSRSSSKSSQNTASSLTDALDSGIQSLQITPTVLTESPRTSPPPLAGLPSPPQATPKYVSTTMHKSPPQAIPLSPPPLYNITSSPICTPPQSIASSSSSSRHISPSPQSSCLKVPPPSDVATPHVTPSQTPAVSPITSPPSLSPYRNTAVKRRVFGDNPVAVHVTNTKSPDHFTVQLDSEQSQLAVLQEMLQDKVEPLQGSVAMGTLYCAQFSDQNWYRCTVIERLPCEMVWVQFVDYGDEKMLHISALRGLPLSISDLPIYGVTCVLAGAVPLDDNWSDSAIDFFTKRVFGKVFYALFKECSPDVYYVALTDTTSLVAQDLVTNGFAKVSI